MAVLIIPTIQRTAAGHSRSDSCVCSGIVWRAVAWCGVPWRAHIDTHACMHVYAQVQPCRVPGRPSCAVGFDAVCGPSALPLATCLYTCLYTCPYTCLYARVWTRLPTCLHAVLPMSIYAHMSIHISTHMYTAMATHLCLHTSARMSTHMSARMSKHMCTHMFYTHPRLWRTWDDQSVFQWSTSDWAKMPHYGQPDVLMFDWQVPPQIGRILFINAGHVYRSQTAHRAVAPSPRCPPGPRHPTPDACQSPMPAGSKAPRPRYRPGPRHPGPDACQGPRHPGPDACRVSASLAALVTNGTGIRTSSELS